MSLSPGLHQLLDAMAGKRVVVWGDLAADHTLYGESSRISREAPVLILNKEWDTVSAGCAGNAVLNIASLGGVPVPVGVLGRDAMGERLWQLFQESGVDTTHIVRPQQGIETAVKMRVLAGGLHTIKQQVIRIDSDGGYHRVGDEEVAARLEDAIADADALIVSDYALGTVRPGLFARVAKRCGISVIDSRHGLADFPAATSATPNEPELEEVSRIVIGDEEERLEEAGRAILTELGLEALLVTRGSRGMSLFERDEDRTDIAPLQLQDIVDVTGAGDTVIAAYTLALAAGAAFEEAARLANVAAGVAVMRLGAVAPTGAEVREALERHGNG